MVKTYLDFERWDWFDITVLCFVSILMPYFLSLLLVISCRFVGCWNWTRVHTRHELREFLYNVYVVVCAIIICVERPLTLMFPGYTAPLTVVVWCSLVWILLLDYFMINYKKNMMWDLVHNAWKSVINAEYVSYYAQNRQKYLAKAYLFSRTCVIFALLVGILFVFDFFLAKYVFVLDAVALLAIVIAFIAVIYTQKQNQVPGKIAFFKEIQAQLLLFGMVCLTRIVLYFVFKHFNPRINTLFDFGIGSCMVLIICYLMYCHHFELKKPPMDSEIPNTSYQDDVYPFKRDDEPESRTGTIESASSRLESVRACLEKPASLHLFMNFLVREFSMENLLFVIEMAQIKEKFFSRQTNKIHKFRMISSTKSMKMVIDIRDYESNKDAFVIFSSLFDPIAVSKDVPVSSIVLDTDIVKQQMNSIYVKYIRSGSDYELNLSQKQRQTLFNVYEKDLKLSLMRTRSEEEKDVFPDEEPDDMFYIHSMDECILQIVKMCRESFRRFKMSDLYEQMLEIVAGSTIIAPNKSEMAVYHDHHNYSQLMDEYHASTIKILKDLSGHGSEVWKIVLEYAYDY